MAFTFASGTGFAVPILASAALLASSGALSTPSPPANPDRGASLEISIPKLRSDKGNVGIALCPAGSPFPDCGEQATRKTQATISKKAAQVQFTELQPGRYAVAAFHDANGNGRLDTWLGIPREGYGFSRNPPFRPRAPRFAEAEIEIANDMRIEITMRYLF